MTAPINRDQLITTIRPNLDLGPASSKEEDFQNRVLRPILKFQNDLILGVFRLYISKYHKNYGNLVKSAQEQIIKRGAKQDPELRNAFINMILGMLTVDEYEEYMRLRAELNKRIVGMVSQRVVSQIEDL